MIVYSISSILSRVMGTQTHATAGDDVCEELETVLGIPVSDGATGLLSASSLSVLRSVSPNPEIPLAVPVDPSFQYEYYLGELLVDPNPQAPFEIPAYSPEDLIHLTKLEPATDRMRELYLDQTLYDLDLNTRQVRTTSLVSGESHYPNAWLTPTRERPLLGAGLFRLYQVQAIADHKCTSHGHSTASIVGQAAVLNGLSYQEALCLASYESDRVCKALVYRINQSFNFY